MTMKTKIINKTDQSFQLKEGNAGAFRLLGELGARSEVPIKVDTNATYREYMVATGKKAETILLSSDDFSEYKVISIVVDDLGPPIRYKSVPSKPRNKGKSVAGAPQALPLTGAPPAPPLTGAPPAPPVLGDPLASSPPKTKIKAFLDKMNLFK